MNTRVDTQTTEGLILALWNWWHKEAYFGVLIPVKQKPYLPTSASGITFCAMEMGVLRLNSAWYSSLGRGLCAVCWWHQIVLVIEILTTAVLSHWGQVTSFKQYKCTLMEKRGIFTHTQITPKGKMCLELLRVR